MGDKKPSLALDERPSLAGLAFFSNNNNNNKPAAPALSAPHSIWSREVWQKGSFVYSRSPPIEGYPVITDEIALKMFNQEERVSIYTTPAGYPGPAKVIFRINYEDREYIVHSITTKNSAERRRIGDVYRKYARLCAENFDFVMPLLYAKTYDLNATQTGPESGVNFMIMPYITGTTLNSFDPNSLPYDVVSSIISQLSDAISQFQQKGYVHKDFNPRNILIDARDKYKVYLIDFEALCNERILREPGQESVAWTCIADHSQIDRGGGRGISANYAHPNALIQSAFYHFNNRNDLHALGTILKRKLAEVSIDGKEEILQQANEIFSRSKKIKPAEVERAEGGSRRVTRRSRRNRKTHRKNRYRG